MSSAVALQESNETLRSPASPAVDAEPRAESLFRFLCLTLTLTLPALFCLGTAYVAEPDVWWHLSSGDWILTHHAFPHVDTFCSTTEGKPWAAYSWLFDVLLSRLYAHFGLAGIVSYSTAMVLGITASLFHLIYAKQKSLRIALPLTAVSALALLTLFSPRPWHFTILFFMLELAIVQKARSGKVGQLFLLPAMFVVWANVHIQFIDGLLLLALVLFESSLFSAQWSKDLSISRVTPVTAGAVLALCVCATLINPYGWHIYTVAHDLAAQTGVVNGIEELKAMPFRGAANYFVLFLTLGAVAVLARRKGFQLFETCLLVAAAVLSFRSQRDIWIVVTASAAILAQGFSSPEEQPSHRLTMQLLLSATAAAAILLLGMGRLVGLTDAALRPKLAAAMPVDAATFVRSHHLSGPVFCDFVWGGYLGHSLDLPVSIDGRAALHGDEQLDISARTWAGAPDWNKNPQLNSAAVVIGPTSAALTQLLRMSPHFELVYQDKLATVFIPQVSAASRGTSLH